MTDHCVEIPVRLLSEAAEMLVKTAPDGHEGARARYLAAMLDEYAGIEQ